jgi:DNA-binding transcriptional MerR regulator
LGVLKENHTLTIGQAAEELGVSISYLRLAERIGTVPDPGRSTGGHRRYTLDDIKRLKRLGIGERKRRLESGDE